MRVLGVLLESNEEISHYILHYPAGKRIESAVAIKRKLTKDARFYRCENMELINGELVLSTPVFRYHVEGWDKLQELLTYFKKGSRLSKELAGIDEQDAILQFNDIGVSIEKSYRSDDFFTEYDYDDSGYSEAQFTGWDSIPRIVSDETGISKDDISTGDGEKLWFSVNVDCRSFVKLKKIK